MFDLARLPCPGVVVKGPSGEHLVIGDARIQIRLDVRLGTVLQGPVALSYGLAGRVGLEPKLETLQRLVALARLGRMPRRPYRPDPRGRRWATALRARDARNAGASHREIATVLFGERRVEAEWNGMSDYLRTRVQRLIRLGESLSRGGYRRLLG
ncbi:MAG: DUF2285 domain-containing protein [Caulobacteraceae bacterium]